MEDNSYNPGDPFFVVECKNCGKQYWSTRRINNKCKSCGSDDIRTNTPKHTIENISKSACGKFRA